MNSTFVLIEGVLSEEAERKSTQKGKTFCNFQIGVETGYGDKKSTGNVKATAWEDVAEQILLLPVGSKFTVYGRLNPRTYEYQGNSKVAVDIVADSIQIRKEWKKSGVPTKTPAQQEIEDSGVPF